MVQYISMSMRLMAVYNLYVLLALRFVEKYLFCPVHVWVQMIELGLADGSLIDELMELTAQSLSQLEIQERFNIIKEIGRGKYGKVLLVTHRFRGMTAL